MEHPNAYIAYLSNHPYLKSQYNDIWIERQYNSQGSIIENIAYFFVLQFNGNSIGVVESTRPNSATLVYALPTKYIHFYRYIYRSHFEDPFISREYRTIGKDDVGYEPIKHRNYFLSEIRHPDFETWEKNLTRVVDDSLKWRKEKSSTFNLSAYLDSKDEELFKILEEFHVQIPLGMNVEVNKREFDLRKHLKSIEKKDVSINSLHDKSINEVAYIIGESPQKLLSILRGKHHLDLSSVQDVLTKGRLRKCKETIELLWDRNKK